ncbi:TetR/AcrR family transcriptional regulator [Actinacidiphila paucisporea]|uniref:TetR/AcrR family transcriptional regulator n=1 Tax=Actinacidiphila paucisporea TaxID=310782 RepID=UPI001F4190C8|nr:TetR/AcrR family transcriptional regulator [Actinacidiphila paucisporea]
MTATTRGRIDKRQAILDAAFTVFTRRGYAAAGMQEIADEAGVAKPTLYNHLGDKETVFRRAMEAAADTVRAENTAIVERLRAPGEDLRAALEDVAHRMLLVCCGERAGALRRLTLAQAGEFPELVVAVHERTAIRLSDALADRLARLSLDGTLRRCEPALAAEQLLALLTGPMEARSRLGTRDVPPDQTRAIARAAVTTFLAAYGPRAADTGNPGRPGHVPSTP